MYIHNTTIGRNIVNIIYELQWTNERTHFFIEIYLSNFILERVAKGLMLVVCERWVRDGDRLLHINPKLFFDHSSTSFSSWLGLLNRGSLRAQALSQELALTRASCPQLTPTVTATRTDWNWLQLTNWLTRTDQLKPSVAPGYIIVSRPPASCGRTHLHRIQPRPQVKVIFQYPRPDAPASQFFCLFTQVHLLIDGSVEGQYVTETEKA